jgi:hypothetical protein
MHPEPSPEQQRVNELLNWAWVNVVFWTCGIGSYRGIGYARQALKLIQASQSQVRLDGTGRATGALILGVVGVLIWVPLVIVGVFVSLTNR